MRFRCISADCRSACGVPHPTQPRTGRGLMAKDQNTFAKRRREMAKKEKAEEKRARRRRKKEEANQVAEAEGAETPATEEEALGE